MKLSIIIPTYFEEDNIAHILDCLTRHPDRDTYEIIVVDGGSKDNTLSVVLRYPHVRLLKSAVASRSIQMNLGARHASHEILYFVHADVQLPLNFAKDIFHQLKTHPAGVYRYQFDSSSWLLKINAYFTRFPMMWCRGGDQTLYITQALFNEIGGYDEYYCVLEDFDILARITSVANFAIMPGEVLVSARKYRSNNYFKVQWINLLAFRKYRRGTNPGSIREFYKQALHLEHY